MWSTSIPYKRLTLDVWKPWCQFIQHVLNFSVMPPKVTGAHIWAFKLTRSRYTIYVISHVQHCQLSEVCFNTHSVSTVRSTRFFKWLIIILTDIFDKVVTVGSEPRTDSPYEYGQSDPSPNFASLGNDKLRTNLRLHNIRGCNQKFPDWVDNEIYAYDNKHLLRSNTKGHGGKTH
jgi:hypothetical protein